jgi:hypothetical protein
MVYYDYTDSNNIAQKYWRKASVELNYKLLIPDSLNSKKLHAKGLIRHNQPDINSQPQIV